MDDPESVASAIEIADSALSDERDILVACQKLVSLRSNLSSISDEIFDTFEGVASEVDDLPLGGDRQYWNDKIFTIKDSEAEDYRKQVRSVVREALLRLLDSLRMRGGPEGYH